MKKFILAIMLVVAPSFAAASGLRCAEGGIAGGLVGSLFGGGHAKIAAEVLGALVGCDIATSLEVQQAPTVMRTVTVVNSGTPVATYSGTPAPTQGVPCPGHWEGTYLMGEGYQRARKNGGITRDGCGSVQRVQNVSQAVYTTTTTETRQAPPQKYNGPTIDSYIDNPNIHPDCKSGNPEADGFCLIGKAQGLMMEQSACVCPMLSPGDPEYAKRQCRRVKEIGAFCPKRRDGFIPGVWGYYYEHLGKMLIAAQEAQQGGKKLEQE